MAVALAHPPVAAAILVRARPRGRVPRFFWPVRIQARPAAGIPIGTSDSPRIGESLLIMDMKKAPQRIATLDIIRGVAVMGILLLNIVSFGMPEAAYFNPRAYGGWHGADLLFYLINFVLFDGKMRGLFSFLFGASLLLVMERAEAAGRNPISVHFNRMIWLLVFGLVHLWLIWDGDVLGTYALCGMIVVAFRGLSVRTLVALGVLLVAVQIVIFAQLPLEIRALEAAPAGSAAAAAAGPRLAHLQNLFGTPVPAEIASELALYRGDYPTLVFERLADNPWGPLPLLRLYVAETVAYMLFGMAALRSGLLRGEWDRRRYWKWLAIGFGVSVPVYVALAAYLVDQQFSLFAIALCVRLLATPVRPLMFLGWTCLIVLLARSGGALTNRLAAAGRMAFTNYLATSLICTTFFYGYGGGWFGYLDRAELYLVVLGIWASILLWSKPWLDRFSYGPLEWLWRSLARRKLQPMRRRLPAQPVPA
jgi:uncharacterized protein